VDRYGHSYNSRFQPPLPTSAFFRGVAAKESGSGEEFLFFFSKKRNDPRDKPVAFGKSLS
jgi:hypothetical protein